MGRHDRNETIRRPREGLPGASSATEGFSENEAGFFSLSHQSFARKTRAEFHEASGKLRGSG